MLEELQILGKQRLRSMALARFLVVLHCGDSDESTAAHTKRSQVRTRSLVFGNQSSRKAHGTEWRDFARFESKSASLDVGFEVAELAAPFAATSCSCDRPRRRAAAAAVSIATNHVCFSALSSPLSLLRRSLAGRRLSAFSERAVAHQLPNHPFCYSVFDERCCLVDDASTRRARPLARQPLAPARLAERVTFGTHHSRLLQQAVAYFANQLFVDVGVLCETRQVVPHL